MEKALMFFILFLSLSSSITYIKDDKKDEAIRILSILRFIALGLTIALSTDYLL